MSYPTRIKYLKRAKGKQAALHDDPTTKSWWIPLWRGLIVDRSAKHYKAMRSALWLYLYLVLHANRESGILNRKVATIANDIGVTHRAVQYWMSKLQREGYIKVKNSGRYLEVRIQKWRSLQGRRKEIA